MFKAASMDTVEQDDAVYIVDATLLSAPYSALHSTRISPDGRAATTRLSSTLLVNVPKLIGGFHVPVPERVAAQV